MMEKMTCSICGVSFGVTSTGYMLWENNGKPPMACNRCTIKESNRKATSIYQIEDDFRRRITEDTPKERSMR